MASSVSSFEDFEFLQFEDSDQDSLGIHRPLRRQPPHPNSNAEPPQNSELIGPNTSFDSLITSPITDPIRAHTRRHQTPFVRLLDLPFQSPLNFDDRRGHDDDDVGGDEKDEEGYDLDDELVPCSVSDKFGRERMRKLGKRTFAQRLQGGFRIGFSHVKKKRAFWCSIGDFEIMLRTRTRSTQKDQDQHQMGHMLISNARPESYFRSDVLGLNLKSNLFFFIVPGLFVGLNPIGLTNFDSVRSPTSPLDFRVFSNLGSPFRSPRPPLHGHKKSWGGRKVGLSIIDSPDDDDVKFPGKVPRSSEKKKKKKMKKKEKEKDEEEGKRKRKKNELTKEKGTLVF